MGKGADPAEKIEFEAGDADAGIILSGRAALAIAGYGGRGRSVDSREELGSLDIILFARCLDVGGGSHEIAIVGKSLGNKRLQPGILEDLLVVEDRKTNFGLSEVRIANWPRGWD